MEAVRVGDCTVCVFRDPFKGGKFWVEIKHDDKRLPEPIIYDATASELSILAEQIAALTKSTL